MLSRSISIFFEDEVHVLGDRYRSILEFGGRFREFGDAFIQCHFHFARAKGATLEAPSFLLPPFAASGNR
jgi:hypothetical protein